MWAQIVNVALGIWLIVSPDVLGFDGAARTIDRAVGPIVVVLGLLAVREVTRVFRYALFLPSLFLLLIPWFLHYPPGAALANDELVAIAMAICAAIPGRRRQRTGGGWLGLIGPQASSETLREVIEG